VTRLRLGIVDYLNSKPLAYAFLPGVEGADELRERYDARFEPPARVAELLAAGELDVGLIPSIELERIPNLEVVPGLCVASEREVRSVLLVSSVPIARVRRLALDVNSRTSVALVRILCAERWGIEPKLSPAKPEIERMLETNDAALVIGDPALRIDPRRHLVFDLAREWFDLTGLPFVFAVWAARRGLDAPTLVADLTASLEQGLGNLDQLVTQAARDLGLDPLAVKDYLTRNLSFRLGPREREGLEEFHRRAHARGLVSDLQPLRLRPAG
jgi:chorismate dehydratase